MLASGLTACTTIRTPSESDPFERFNRGVFQFNDALDHVAFRPVAKAYNYLFPQRARNSVSNFFSNLGDVRTMLNSLLQGEFTAGIESLMRITINTVFGAGGLFDVASAAGLPKHYADFGQTLGVYGAPPGPYLMLPLLGPSTVREAGALLIDWQTTPMAYLNPIHIRTKLYGLHFVSQRATLLQTGDLLMDAALDKYSFVRDAYLQSRQYLLRRKDTLPDYEDDSAPPIDTNVPAQQIMPPLRHLPDLRFR